MQTIEYDPNRSANIANVLNWVTGEQRYILAPVGLVRAVFAGGVCWVPHSLTLSCLWTTLLLLLLSCLQKVGDLVRSGDGAEIKTGHALTLADVLVVWWNVVLNLATADLPTPPYPTRFLLVSSFTTLA